MNKEIQSLVNQLNAASDAYYNGRDELMTDYEWDAAFDKLKRGVATFSLNLAFGEPDLMPETPIELSGFKAEIDATNWLVTRVTHNLSDSGFTSQIECELKVEDEEVDVKKEKK